MEIGALGSPDLAIVRRTREALVPAYDQASDWKDWDQTHTIGVLREALAQPDSAAYLAYRVRDNRRAAHTAAEYAEALAIVGCAADTLTVHRRPWEIEPNDLSLPEWRERVWKLLFAMPGNALPKPTEAKVALVSSGGGSHATDSVGFCRKQPGMGAGVPSPQRPMNRCSGVSPTANAQSRSASKFFQKPYQSRASTS